MNAGEAEGRGIEHYRQRVEQNPDSAAAHYNLGLAYTQQGWVGRAERHYRKAVELRPDLVEAWVNLGGALLLKWDFRGSIAANEEALKRKPDLLQAHFNIGQARLYLGEADGVVRSCRRVVELDPDHAGGHYFLAVGLLATGNPAEAREELARARTLGYSPAPEFLRALDAAAKQSGPNVKFNIVKDSGGDPPDTEKED